MYSHVSHLLQWNVPARKPLLAALSAAASCLPPGSAWAQTTATVIVAAASVTAAVPPEGYGLNRYVWDNHMLSSGVASELQSVGVNGLRNAGGSDSDLFDFIGGTDQTMNSGAYLWASDTFNNFMSEAALPEGGKPIITVNCGSNLDHNGDGRQWIVYASYANTAGAWGMEYGETFLLSLNAPRTVGAKGELKP